MPLVTTGELFKAAEKGGYALPAFNANCLEMIPPLVEAAEAEGAALILQIGRRFLQYLSPVFVARSACYLAETAKVPVAVHLDHGAGIEQVRQCLEAGFTSIMYDGSSLSFEENITRTKEVALLCSSRSIPVEGETGKVPVSESGGYGNLDWDLTEVGEAVEYAERTGVDSLAVAVGNLHRMNRKEAKIDFDRIKRIHRELKIPLVIHGSSGISPEDLKQAIACGIRKVNIATEFNLAFLKGYKDCMDAGKDEWFPMEPLKWGMEKVRDLARERIGVLGANDRYR
ncbi:MAG: class II fructose-bisphosphate aldolase [Treponema sp.]|jgi:fructose-bisphosphate aldolase class II|nr:class II fructose-bisphosphate aldolase [Treponema sp.]